MCAGLRALGSEAGAADLASSIHGAVRGGSQGQQADTLLLGLNDVQGLQGGQVPDPDVAPRCAVQARPADGDALHRLLMPLQGAHLLALPHIPHLHPPRCQSHPT